MALSLGNVGKCNFLKGEDVFSEKGLLEKTAKVKKCEYSPLGSELKKQTDIAKDQYKLLKVQKIIFMIRIEKMVKSGEWVVKSFMQY